MAKNKTNYENYCKEMEENHNRQVNKIQKLEDANDVLTN